MSRLRFHFSRGAGSYFVGKSMYVGEFKIEETVEVERFKAAILEADDVGAVIRCHYEAERSLHFILAKLTGGRSVRKAESWSFAIKLEVCRLFGLKDTWINPFKLLNDHRNDFAHKGRDRLEEQQVLDMYRAVHQLHPKFSEDFRLTIMGELDFDKAYRDCSRKEKYVMALMLVASLFYALPKISADDWQG